MTTAYAAGLRVSEVVALKVSDVESDRMVMRIENCKGANCDEATRVKRNEAARKFRNDAAHRNEMMSPGQRGPPNSVDTWSILNAL